jgi:NtrC-family two-component system response regulator AlgB
VVAVSNSKDAIGEVFAVFDRPCDLRLGQNRAGFDSQSPPIIQLNCDDHGFASRTRQEAMRQGFDYLPKPFTPDQISLLIRKIIQVRTLEQRVAVLQEALKDAAPEIDLTSRNPAMQRTLSIAHREAESDATVLIRGESGTGKTILARPALLSKWAKILV